MTEIIPDELMFPSMVWEVIAFLKKLGVQPRLKKETLIAWSKETKMQLTQAMFQELLGEFYDMV